MDFYTRQGLKQPKPVLTNLILSIIAVILLFFSLTDLFVSKKFRQIWIHLLILTIGGSFITRRLVVDALAIGHSSGY